jgi:voltage-gated potassium channel
VKEHQFKALAALAALGFAVAPEELSFERLKQQGRELAARDPANSALATVLVGAYLFYQAEKGKNPKVNTYGDALVFVSTCLSVGFTDIFARTEEGKIIATALMTFGPPIAARALDPPAAAAPRGRS